MEYKTVKDSGERQCIRCERPEVYSNKMCRSCYEKDLLCRNAAYKDRQRLNSREWRRRNPDKVREQARRRTLDPRCRERDRRTKQKARLKKRGLTEESSAMLLRLQNNCCAICGRCFETIAATHLDHDKKTGLARGYLCSRCNNGLGMFEESTLMLLKAVRYLQSPIANNIFDKELCEVGAI